MPIVIGPSESSSTNLWVASFSVKIADFVLPPVDSITFVCADTKIPIAINKVRIAFFLIRMFFTIHQQNYHQFQSHSSLNSCNTYQNSLTRSFSKCLIWPYRETQSSFIRLKIFAITFFSRIFATVSGTRIITRPRITGHSASASSPSPDNESYRIHC